MFCFFLSPSVSILFPHSAGQLLREHFPERMIQHSKWPKGLLCSNLNQKSLSLSDGHLAVSGEGSSQQQLPTSSAPDSSGPPARSGLTRSRATGLPSLWPTQAPPANHGEPQLQRPRGLKGTRGLTCPGRDSELEELDI